MSDTSQKLIRAWARRQGLKVGERGRLHPDILKAYANRSKVSGDQLAESSQIAREADVLLGIKVIYDKKVHKYVCGFCGVGNHDRCPGSIRNGENATSSLTFCACGLQDHGGN